MFYMKTSYVRNYVKKEMKRMHQQTLYIIISMARKKRLTIYNIDRNYKVRSAHYTTKYTLMCLSCAINGKGKWEWQLSNLKQNFDVEFH